MPLFQRHTDAQAGRLDRLAFLAGLVPVSQARNHMLVSNGLARYSLTSMLGASEAGATGACKSTLGTGAISARDVLSGGTGGTGNSSAIAPRTKIMSAPSMMNGAHEMRFMEPELSAALPRPWVVGGVGGPGVRGGLDQPVNAAPIVRGGYRLVLPIGPAPAFCQAASAQCTDGNAISSQGISSGFEQADIKAFGAGAKYRGPRVAEPGSKNYLDLADAGDAEDPENVLNRDDCFGFFQCFPCRAFFKRFA